MESVPNWFRWLIVVIATLIMCACRAPLQRSAKTPTASALLRDSIEPSPRAQVVQSLSMLQEDLETRRISGPTSSPVQTFDTEEPSTYRAPIVRRPSQQSSMPTIQQVASDPSPTHVRAPVYLQVNDRESSVSPTQAIVASPESEESPFLDDPASPSDVIAPAPMIDPTFEPPATMIAPSPRTLTHMDSTSEYVPEVVVGPGIPVALVYPMMDYSESIPMASTICETPQLLAAPFDYLPQAEIPCIVAPEKWAIPPGETMEVSYTEMSKRYPDEYVCDGGDAMGEVNVLPDWTLNNLDAEDTVGHYDTLNHQVVVAPSNRVCIYAPRFAAVRKVTSPFQNDKYAQARIEQREDLAVIEQQDRSSVSYQQTVAARHDLRVQPASSLQRELPGVTGVHTLPVREINGDFSAHEDFRVMKLGIHKQADKPLLADYTTKAITWSADKAVQVVVDGVVAHANSSVKGIEAIHTIGDNRPAKLRVIKTASVSDALPGEEVEFTLRFDNIGHQPMGNVTIIDNLTTRLEYLNNTELCSLENNFVADDNDVDSLTLRWEIIDPIKPGHGGLIRFKCRVR